MENQGKDPRSLEERLAAYPEVLDQLRQMADELGSEQGTLDEVEDKMIARVRQLGRELLGGCARQMAAQAPVPVGTKVRRHVKKKYAG